MAIELRTPGTRPADLTPGTLVYFDASRAECWADGAPVNLAGAQALDLIGSRLDGELVGKTANITLSDGMLGFGAERAGIAWPVVLTDRLDALGPFFAISLWFRMIPGAVVRHEPGRTVTSGTRVWADNLVFTTTTGGALGPSKPTHTSGSASNGAATLRAGVPFDATPNYGIVAGQNVLSTDARLSMESNLDPAPQYGLVDHISSNGFVIVTESASGARGYDGLINHVTFSGSERSYNGVFASGGRLVPTNSGRRLVFRPTVWNAAQLYNATTGFAPANTAGLRLGLAKIVVEDLISSGMTHREYACFDRQRTRAWHRLRDWMA